MQTLLDFSLSDQVYARAKLKDVDSVGLWLGAGLMVEYSLEEAKKLLVRLFLPFSFGDKFIYSSYLLKISS